MKYRLHYEENFAKDKLKDQTVISSTDELFIDVDAAKLARSNIKSLSLSADMNPETIANHIEHDLAQIHHGMPKTTLTEVTRLSVVYTQQLIDQHNSLHHSQHSDKSIDNYENNKPFNLSKDDLPILALALASEMINHHNTNKMNVSENYINATHISSIDNNIGDHHIQVEHLINNLKISFKSRLEQDSIHFEQHHQQQVAQMQINQQHSMEI
jgi:hypothetical protein